MEKETYDIIEVTPKFKVGDRVDCYKYNVTDTEILGVRVGHTVWGEAYISYDIKDGIVLTSADEKDLCKAKKYVIKESPKPKYQVEKLLYEIMETLEDYLTEGCDNCNWHNHQKFYDYQEKLKEIFGFDFEEEQNKAIKKQAEENEKRMIGKKLEIPIPIKEYYK